MNKQDIEQIRRFRAPRAQLIALKKLAEKGKITTTPACKPARPAV